MDAFGRYRVIALSALVVLALGCSCGPQAPEEERAAILFDISDVERMDRAGALADSGYALLEQDRFDEGIALMKESQAALPESRGAHYNLACAYSKAGDQAAALEQLELAVAAGWDDAYHLENDPDLEPLREDPAFSRLVDEARANGTERLQGLARGLPDVEFDQQFPDADSLDNWYRNEYRSMRTLRRHLFGWQLTQVRLELEAKRIAARRLLDPPDTTFDEGLERVRAFAGNRGFWQAWGPIADGAIHEAREHLASDPAPSSRDHALYLAGAAEYCKTLPGPEDPEWSEAVNRAREWFAQIPAGSDFEGGAIAWNLMFDLKEAGEDVSALHPRLRELGSAYGDDRWAMDVAYYFFMDDLITAEWPIPFEATDMEGQKVTLEQFRGRPLLLCYWATW